MNVIISGVSSQANNDNFSDDDVIEVVRDEAPIEILSDGEERELEMIKSQPTSVIQDFHFTSVPTIVETHSENIQRTDAADIEDPLRNISLDEKTDVTNVHANNSNSIVFEQPSDADFNTNDNNIQTDDQTDKISVISSTLQNNSELNVTSEIENTPDCDSIAKEKKDICDTVPESNDIINDDSPK
ncbi:unnamed protein product [Chilo suppressalis]|uniref:Seminal fluid protein n=1 Tax=Chilo suppressalis TaxID=168631 RepID=A0ABN8AZS8_CHISP|nr:unnamed protein product [Chilo suppressalis]